MSERLHPQSMGTIRRLVELHGGEAVIDAVGAMTGKKATRLEPTDEDRRIEPDVQIVGDNLMALVAIKEACNRLSWRGEWYICSGLLLELATVIEGETPADSALHKLVAKLMEEV